MLIAGLAMVVFDALIQHIPYHLELVVVVVAIVLAAYSLVTIE
jgi:hypothetical protein